MIPASGWVFVSIFALLVFVVSVAARLRWRNRNSTESPAVFRYRERKFRYRCPSRNTWCDLYVCVGEGQSVARSVALAEFLLSCKYRQKIVCVPVR